MTGEDQPRTLREDESAFSKSWTDDYPVSEELREERRRAGMTEDGYWLMGADLVITKPDPVIYIESSP